MVERFTPRPLVDIRKFVKNENIWKPAAIIFFDQFSMAMSYTPLYQWSLITFGLSVTNATYFLYTQSLCGVMFGILGGLIASFPRRYKWVTLPGSMIRLLGLGLMYRYRNGASSTVQAVIPQVIQGIGGGFLTANLMAAVQAAVPHSQVAIVSGICLLILEVGSAIGSAVVGAIQKQLKEELTTALARVPGVNAGSAAFLKGAYPIGSPLRIGVTHAWSENMRHIIQGALPTAAVAMLLCVFLPDRKLSDGQNLVDHSATAVLVPQALATRQNHEDEEEVDGRTNQTKV